MAIQGDIGEVDVLIAGAGPSGSAAANLLSEAGYSVMMLERKMEIGSPVICADLVNLSLDGLESLARDQRIFLKPLKELRVEGPSRLGSFGMQPANSDSDAFNSVVERDRLDKELASIALIKGAKLRIRSELTELEEKDGGVIATYTTGGKRKNLRARFVVLSAGVSGFPVNPLLNQRRIENNYTYSRKIGKGDGVPLFQIKEVGELEYYVPRFDNEYNRIAVNSAGEHIRDGFSEDGDSIITGSISSSLPEEFSPGGSIILNVGSFSGLNDPFFLTGFREAYISGRLAASAIMESDSNPQNAAPLYSNKVASQMLHRIQTGSKLRNLLKSTSREKIDAFVQYLSGFQYREISALEIVRSTSISDSELREMLPPDH